MLKWGREVASAIAHAHDHQVLHCDLKPANIVITADDRAKVLDFGISRATFDGGDSDEPLRGTMPYMAPEQLLWKQFTPAGDIYSLGVTLFELATGRLPFDGEGDVLRLQIIAAPPPRATELVPELVPELETVLERAMAKPPDRRYRSVRSLERALAAAEEGVHYTTGTIPVPARPSVERLSLWSRIGLSVLGLFSLLALITMLGAYTSAVYNQTVGAADFANDSLWDWLNRGLRASGGPFALTIIVLAASSVGRIGARALLRASHRAAMVHSWLSEAWSGLRSRLGPDEATRRGVVALLVSIGALAVAVVSYRDLFPAFVAVAATSPAEQLALLSPIHVFTHNAFRRAFGLAVIVSIAVWYHALNRPDLRRAVPRGLVAAGIVTLLATLVLLHHPHRLMFNELGSGGAEVARWRGHECYVLGQRGSDTLLLCPSATPRRHAIVRTGDPELEHTGDRESVFTGFYRLANPEDQEADAR